MAQDLQDANLDAKGGLLAQALTYWHSLLKWKWSAALFFTAVVGAATIYSFVLPPVYTSRGSVWIENNPRILPFDDVDSFGPETNLQSHVQLLQSRSLAWDTIEKLKLYENPDFVKKRRGSAKALDPQDPMVREALIESFLKTLGVVSVERTSLVMVEFSNRNPRLAADALNALFEGYIDMIVRKRYSASEKASEFLNTQIAELRSEIESKEKDLNQYGSQKDILPLTASEMSTVSGIGDINKALTEATLERVNKLNYYNQLKNAPLGGIPEAPEGSLIQRLREQYITLSRQYATRLSTVRPEYPEMQRLKTELDSATEALQNETQNLIRNAYNDYETALRKEQSLQSLLNDKKNEAYKANNNSVLYNSLRIELENKKALVESLSKRQDETNVSSRLKGLEALNVWIVDKANYPLKPSAPKKKKNVFLGFVLGLAGGIGLALGLEYLNHTVKTSKDISMAIGVPTLGSVPAFEAEARAKGPRAEYLRLKSMLGGREDRKRKEPKHHAKPEMPGAEGPSASDGTMGSNTGGDHDRIELIAIRGPQSIQAESYRSIRTTLLVSSPPGKIRTILFTSPLAREGKSSTVSNLGVTLAEAGRRVVVMDADLRKPKQGRIFGTREGAGPGLSQYLSGLLDPAEVIKPTGIENLHLITSGPPPANPIELLTAERMDGLVAFLKKNYDYVLFDTPPILAVSDALALAPMAEAIILVVRGGQTPIPALKQAKQKLDTHKLKCLGVILNGVDLLEQDGYYARQYYHYAKQD